MINEAPANTQAEINDTVLFNCSMEYEPVPTLTWSSNSSASIAPSREERDEDVPGGMAFSQITISNVQISDYQYYTCTGVSAINTETLTAALGGTESFFIF